LRAQMLASLMSVLLLTSTSGSFACGNGTVLFQDSMQSPDPSWGNDQTRSAGPNGATWKLRPGYSKSPLNQTSLYEDFEVCVTASMDHPEQSGGSVGVSFWGEDADNLYAADLFPRSGSIDIIRLQRGKLLKPVPVQKNSAIITDPNGQNEIDVVVKGNHGTLFVNGTKVTEFTGNPPEGGGLVGLDFGAQDDDPDGIGVTFANFQVRALDDNSGASDNNDNSGSSDDTNLFGN
jgi:3-keto-disaccharide hydrolase